MAAGTLAQTLTDDNYDEFGLLHENAAEWGVPFTGRPTVTRISFETAPGQTLSAIKWGEGEPELVFLHGGGQNAHTWDTVILALGRPALAIDAPGHGHSYWREDRDYGPWLNTEAYAKAIPHLAPKAQAVVGMSLGGATTIRLAATYPDLVRKAVIVDVTPQVNDPSRQMALMDRGTVALIGRSHIYESFEAMADAAVALSPYRAAGGVRRGVRHNAKRLADGTWTWRYDLGGPRPQGSSKPSDFTLLWDDVSKITAASMLVVGGASKYVLPEDTAEMLRRQPTLRVESVAGAGHAVQSDKPLELKALIEDFVF
jgi:pimeloyl-ACP methyl ester carboxylesterase